MLPKSRDQTKNEFFISMEYNLLYTLVNCVNRHWFFHYLEALIKSYLCVGFIQTRLGIKLENFVSGWLFQSSGSNAQIDDFENLRTNCLYSGWKESRLSIIEIQTTVESAAPKQ